MVKAMPMRQWGRLVGLLLGVMILMQFINSTISFGMLSAFGILPRTPWGLLGIPFAPLIHHSWGHLLANLIPLGVLCALVCQLGARFFWLGTSGIIFLGGFGVWLFGASGVHAGASGLIFGYWAMLLAYAWYNRSFKSVIVAAVVVILYGGMLWGFLDMRLHISWSSHFFSAVAGVFMAKWLSRLSANETFDKENP
jgi:membrane associated rhomboid family serine protease